MRGKVAVPIKMTPRVAQFIFAAMPTLPRETAREAFVDVIIACVNAGDGDVARELTRALVRLCRAQYGLEVTS